MNNPQVRLKNHRSLTSLTIARPFFVKLTQKFSQEDQQAVNNKSHIIENSKTHSNHTKCTILIKQ